MSVYANDRSIIHKGDNGVHTAAPPDVCKTPSPAGPVPIPYVNVANSSDLSKGTKKVKIEGNATANADSNLSTSMGDEPGTAGGGLISSKFKGKMTWTSTSTDVKSEGKGVARFMDPVGQNSNTFNTAFISVGGTGMAYGDDFREPCVICGKGPKSHRIIETRAWREVAMALRKRLQRVDRARALNNQGDPPRVARQRFDDDGKPDGRGRGFMVGVMLCKCGEKWATNSGDASAGFDEVAGGGPGGLGYNLIPGGTATQAQCMAANPSVRGAAVGRFQGQWQAMTTMSRARRAPGEPNRYNPPGQCAAAKLVAKSGHVPETLTEFFFQPADAPRRWSQRYMVYQRHGAQALNSFSPLQRGLILQNYASTQHDVTYYSDRPSAVASCQTCQSILPMMLCNRDRRDC
jgi:hypothetical protein